MPNLKVLIPKIEKNMSEYEKRSLATARKWAEGCPEHNHYDNECCPDFSCCYPEQFTENPITRLKIFWAWFNRRFYKGETINAKSNVL